MDSGVGAGVVMVVVRVARGVEGVERWVGAMEEGKGARVGGWRISYFYVRAFLLSVEVSLEWTELFASSTP